MNKDRGEASRRPPNAAGRSSTPRRGAPLEMRRGRAKAERLVADMGGSAALPRRNGELVFEAPWESQAFGMAIAFSDQGHYDWEQFRQRLIAEIGDWERSDEDERAVWDYYRHWLASLESLLEDRGLVSEGEIDERTAQIASKAEHEHHHGE
jgi:nitrile hydratase accessory protein